ncbi:tRNA (adenosine(37)-N6)-threonylcarbamoyltransferase complex dimerization subunit type 1 TsaB [Halobacillus shinanisalinarum]|uniref:tRNA (Adenosine(37)-N6)-threonylcarbamoyltransferase complex dimerization subunit type 1 TsaB n=1 Tax=Halobacillus shinanisalinarum TaxID=2932258 RepID=A0ABY4GUJ4_9BACI|nr:tRNA (adenosine(37)-N6)-threonylcarbamoyltransferase complex dimerization subunit type 1 TsaB [Halobacillus shinanisalinarum]UOQ91813.1 tRNA (adenosine(37)-N6)-threonylcarbamoyltransferase complex dimerization subunit type 1 TsaB [Halobacillus shinanisalinarum]
MNVLAIDTSNYVMGVAVVKEGIVTGELVTNIKKNHSIRLMPAIDQLMSETATKPEDLDRIAVAHGPGSYTGVRIGLTTAKTMAWSLQIPVVGVSSLEAVARQGELFSGYVCPFFDARRGLVYTGLYDSNMEILKAETNILMESWLDQLKGMDEPILFLSQDIGAFEESIKDGLGEKAVIPSAAYHYARPSLVALAGAAKQPVGTHELVPNYLRIPEAEAKWLAQQEKK